MSDNIRISGLNALTQIKGVDYFPIVQSGSLSTATTYRTAITVLGDYFNKSGSAWSASFASRSFSSSHAIQADTASYLFPWKTYATTASNAVTASYSFQSSTASYAFDAISASYAKTSSVAVSSSYSLTSSYSRFSSYNLSSSWATQSINSNNALFSISSSWASRSFSSSYSDVSRTSSFALTAGASAIYYPYYFYNSTIFAIPPDVYKVEMVVYGGGGGGGGRDLRVSGYAFGQGGGGAGFARRVISVVPNQQLVIVVGAGGAAGYNQNGGPANPGNGYPGGETSVTILGNSTPSVAAEGGNGGYGGKGNTAPAVLVRAGGIYGTGSANADFSCSGSTGWGPGWLNCFGGGVYPTLVMGGVDQEGCGGYGTTAGINGLVVLVF